MSQTCRHALLIQGKLLSPPFERLLQGYIDHWKVDPRFLVYHRASTNLRLRHELGLPLGGSDVCRVCDFNTLMNCQVAAILEGCMVQRIAEEEAESVKRLLQ